MLETGSNSFFPDQQPIIAETETHGDMMVDPDEFVTEQAENEKDEVAIINPDHLGSDTEMVDRPRADDCMFIIFDSLFLCYGADIVWQLRL